METKERVVMETEEKVVLMLLTTWNLPEYVGPIGESFPCLIKCTTNKGTFR